MSDIANRKNDYDYPIRYLHKAYGVLEKEGVSKFREFVIDFDMPVEDIERVQNKYNYKHDEDFKKKVDAIIENLKLILNKGSSDITVPF